MAQIETQVVNIIDLLEIFKEEKIIIPSFQRNFVWNQQDIAYLFDSIYHGYPIGNFLFWKVNMRTQKRKIDAVIDGQQRLISLIGVLLWRQAKAISSYEDERNWKLYFNLREKNFVFLECDICYLSLHLLPIGVIADTLDYLGWLKSVVSSPLTKEQEDLIREADEVSKAIREYKIPFYRVEGGEEEVREIFDRINYLEKPQSFNID